ncbi:xanthine dehydrogenase accessory protein XdhC [Rhizobium sp.]|jgi:xanthine dehydrogenase accessory factor|uniref:xanthine dehydrogenase accessory protein XdhC n=1 Tax=Rhizobium sp. TaxID=391 RepID=UPI000E96BDF7|nr:xanthine dehydrogenase accessory protein XdhC [Rhizobium sp.]
MSLDDTASLTSFLNRHPDVVMVTVVQAKGSTPRDAGTFMLVGKHALFGTIGGGQLEFIGIEKARKLLADGLDRDTLSLPLGPEIGQCCGGWVELALEVLTVERRAALDARMQRATAQQPQVFIFGAGHVGLALTAALSPLPFRVVLLDSREHIDGEIPHGTDFRRVALPEAQVAEIAQGGAAVILTHDHALDFLIAREALARDDLAYIGMIGSATKRATFAHWLAREGGDKAQLTRLTLPIGAGPIKDKRPAVIAALVAAELLHKLC